jgi:hypothetical protein
VPGKPIEVFAPVPVREDDMDSISFRVLFQGTRRMEARGVRLVEILDSNGSRISDSELEALGRQAALPNGLSVTLVYRSPTSLSAILTALALLWNPGEKVVVISSSIPGGVVGEVLASSFKGEGFVKAYNVNPAYFTIGEFIGFLHDIVGREEPGMVIIENADLLGLMGSRDDVIDEIINLTTFLRKEKVTPVYIYYGDPYPEVRAYGGIYIEANPRPEITRDTHGRMWQQVNVSIESSFLNINLGLRYNAGLLSEVVREKLGGTYGN